MLVTPYTKHRYHTLDGMRGIAAIFVMLFHYFASSGQKWLMNGFIAVDFFFVLSGFVVLHSYGQKLLSGMPARVT